MKLETNIRKTFHDLHQVTLTIDHQTFHLQPREPEPKLSSLEHAIWLQKQLNTALNKLEHKEIHRLTDQLKTAIAEEYQNYDDNKCLIMGRKSYTGTQVAKEIKKETL